MLTKISLTNFKRHRDLTITFDDGINATRGANEAGKSSLLHAIAYALFGTKALPHSLDDTVTWGCDTKTLKVELSLEVSGESYTFKRGKSGAEVIKAGEVFVTGQNEVTAFASNLLGADGNASTKLMFASQNGLRGALEEGPKALSQMIEDLAGFDTFDTIMEAAQEKLVLGAPSMLEDRLKQAQAALEEASEVVPEEPNQASHDAEMAAHEAMLETMKAGVPEAQKNVELATDKLAAASTLFLKRNAIETSIAQTSQRVNIEMSSVAGHEANAGKTMPDVAGLEVTYNEALEYDKRSNAYSIFVKAPQGDRYTGTREQFDAELSVFKLSFDENKAELRRIEQAVVLLNATRINHDTCEKCGQDVTHLENVVKTNTEVDRQLAELLPRKLELQVLIASQTGVQAEFDGYLKLERNLAATLSKISGYITLDESVYPPVPTWSGSIPGDVGPDTKAYKERLDNAKEETASITQATTRLEMARAQLEKSQAELTALQVELREFVGPDAEDILGLTAAKDEAVSAKLVLEGNIILRRQEMNAKADEFKSAKTIWASAVSRVEASKKQIAQCQKDIETLGFNNALVKKLRAIRPAVADKLWNTVLASVSVMFSQMRGQESWVTKTKEGFKVNGQAVESLSGSTLDLLGLSIRCALLKTFLPQCSLLILDEPAHGCDAERTEALIGFIAGAGFRQTILVTHEDISESMANNIIQL